MRGTIYAMNDTERIGAMVLRYKDTAARITDLRSAINEKIKRLKNLVDVARSRYDGDQVTLGQDVLLVQRSVLEGSEPDAVPLTLLSDLYNDLIALKEAQATEERVAACLEQAGLEGIVQRSH